MPAVTTKPLRSPATSSYRPGLQFSTSYTFAKNLSNGQGYDPTAFTTQAGGTVSDIYNIGLDYGNVAFTVVIASSRHSFTRCRSATAACS